MSEEDTIRKIAEQVERHRHQGRAVFSIAGIQMLLDLVNRTGPTDEQFRAMGYTGAARQYPMPDLLAMRMFAAYNGVTVDRLPETFKYHPNQWCADAWGRVANAAREHLSKAA